MRGKMVADIMAAGLILLLLYTALSKLLDFAVFRYQVSLSPLLSPIAGFIAWTIPITEIGIVGLLLQPMKRLWGFYAATGLMILFTGYVAIMLTTYAHLPCTCGGIVTRLSWPAHLVLNIILTAMAIIGIIIEKRNKQKLKSMSIYTPS